MQGRASTTASVLYLFLWLLDCIYFCDFCTLFIPEAGGSLYFCGCSILIGSIYAVFVLFIPASDYFTLFISATSVLYLFLRLLDCIYFCDFCTLFIPGAGVSLYFCDVALATARTRRPTEPMTPISPGVRARQTTPRERHPRLWLRAGHR